MSEQAARIVMAYDEGSGDKTAVCLQRGKEVLATLVGSEAEAVLAFFRQQEAAPANGHVLGLLQVWLDSVDKYRVELKGSISKKKIDAACEEMQGKEEALREALAALAATAPADAGEVKTSIKDTFEKLKAVVGNEWDKGHALYPDASDLNHPNTPGDKQDEIKVSSNA